MLKLAKGLLPSLFLLASVLPCGAETSLDGERLDLEMRMQQRVEEALGKIIPPSQLVVVIRIDPVQPPAAKVGVEQIALIKFALKLFSTNFRCSVFKPA